MPSHQGQGAYSDCSSPASTISMDPHSPDSGHSKTGRQRLKPWLEAQVNSNRHPGLQWLDKEKRIFRMTWKHGGRADWSEEDGSIFKAWALHTGKYREGIDEPDWPTWKTRLRCAINKQKPDITELKDRSCMEEPHPFRVFQFSDARKDSGSDSPPRSGRPSSVGGSEEDSYRFPVQDRPTVIQTNSGNIPTIINGSLESRHSLDRQEERGDAQAHSLDMDLKNMSLSDLVPATNISLTNISLDSTINSYSEAMDTDSLQGGTSGRSLKVESSGKINPALLQNIGGGHEMLVTLRFRNSVIAQNSIINAHGCRVFYGDVPYEQAWDPEMFGRREADQILVPYTPGQIASQNQDQYTQCVLKGLEHGINFTMDNLNIYLERRCKSRIITVPANKGHKSTTKLERQQRLKVFDFSEDFLPALERYQQGQGPRPDPQVVVGIGQDFLLDGEPYTNLFLSVTVCHTLASHLLAQNTAATSAPEMSHSDQFDQRMSLLKKENLTIPITNFNNAQPQTTPAVDDASHALI